MIKGHILVGVDEITRAKYAIKIMNKKKIKKMKIIDKIKREIKIQSHMRHPHILKLYEYFETKNELFIVLEYA